MLYIHYGTNWIYYIHCTVINVILADNFFYNASCRYHAKHPTGASIYWFKQCIFIWMNDKEYLSLHDATSWRRRSMTLCMCNNHCRKRITYSCGTIMYPLVPCPFNTVPCELTPENNLMALPWKSLKTTHQNSCVSFRYTMLVILSNVYHFIVSNQQANAMQSWGYESAATSSKKETKFARYCFSCNLKKSDMIAPQMNLCWIIVFVFVACIVY